ncbi:MAG TPA: hypothetical protein VGH27_18260 [Streptosporangiaceae bacterium]|jgi:pyrrolidone-carboxylate peptidase
MKILVQGFGPFGRFLDNPSELLVRALANQAPTGCELHADVLQTTADDLADPGAERPGGTPASHPCR